MKAHFGTDLLDPVNSVQVVKEAIVRPVRAATGIPGIPAASDLTISR